VESKGKGLSEITHLINPSSSKHVVEVFVRKGSYEGERILSFTLPPGVPASEIVRRGFAIDGNRAVAVIEWYTAVNDEDEPERLVTRWNVRDGETGADLDDEDPLSSPEAWSRYHPKVLQVLHDAERLVIEWLSGLGYEVQFK
jgi:hypothetical protein